MRSIIKTLCLATFLATAAGCGGEAADQPPVQPPAPPPAPTTPPPADTTPAPQADTTPAPAPKPAMADLVKASIAAFPAAFGDGAKYAALYAPDASLVVAGVPEIKGHDAIQAYHQAFFDAETGEKLTLTRAWVKGNMYAVEWILTGTQSKDLNGMPASDKPWGLTGASLVWLNDDGLVIKDHRFFDQATYAAQVTGKGKVRPIPDAPTGPTEMHVAKGDPSEDKNADTAKSFNRVFEKGDLKGFLDGLADDTVYDDYASPAQLKGKGAAKAFFVSYSKAFPSPKIVESNVFGVEDFTIDEYEMDATQKAPLSMGPGATIPNTKKSIGVHSLEILQWKDGKVAHGWGYSNGLEFMTQLGLVPAPGDKAPDAKGAKGAKPAKK